MRVLLLAIFLMGVADRAVAASCGTVNFRCEASLSATVLNAGRATVMVRVPGQSQCTGTLLNNVRGDGRPYILLARHCAANARDSELPALAGTAEITYGYETPCGETQAAAPLVSVGAIHRATYRDAWLIEALTPPPAAADAFLAGIYLGGGTRRAFGIHHGNGQSKQFVEQQVTTGNIVFLVIGLLGETLQTWKTSLLRGSTPHGSSGSALFDEQTRVLGVLSGGNSCAGDGNDYQQISEVWKGGGGTTNSLRAWLDPDKVGIQSIAGGALKGLSGQSPQPPTVVEGGSDVSNASGGGGGSLSWWFLSILLLASGRRVFKSRIPT